MTAKRELALHCISEARTSRLGGIAAQNVAAQNVAAQNIAPRSTGVEAVGAEGEGVRLPGGSARPHSALEFPDVYDSHFDFVWRSLRLLGVADEVVEDAIQDTFSVVSRQLGQFEGRSSLRTWIFAILHRVAANYRRKRQRKQSPLVPLEELPSDDPSPEAHAEAVEAAGLIERFCAGLEPERRALFVLAVLEEAPPAEVAATLGLPIHKVYSRVHTLREGLRRELAAREAERG